MDVIITVIKWTADISWLRNIVTGFCSVACSLKNKDVYVLFSANTTFSILCRVVSLYKFIQKEEKPSKPACKSICWL